MPTTAVASPVAGKRSFQRVTVMSTLLLFIVLGALVPLFAPLPSISSHFISSSNSVKSDDWRFEIADDKFWKDGEPFRIIGGDVHYFRIHPQYWEDRLLRAKALGLNTIQTYVPWNLHERRRGEFVFEGFADIVSFLKLCQKLDLLVMLRPGPYICAEWDLGGFPAWILAIEPALRLRSSDPVYIDLVEKWWKNLLPKLSSLLYINGGPIIMVQIENEFGSYSDDKAYLHHLVKLANKNLGDGVILYTTDGGTRETLEKGTIYGDKVFSDSLVSASFSCYCPCCGNCLVSMKTVGRFTVIRVETGAGKALEILKSVDFTTGDEPWPIFNLQKKFNIPGKSPPLSAEFYTGWLTHWGEKIATTDASFTSDFLEKILSRNGSVVLYMAHGGTNFGFYNGANTGADESDYKADLTSYDYDAPITESGDVQNAKYKALRSVISRYSMVPLASVPKNNEIASYGNIKLKRSSYLFDIIGDQELVSLVESETPVSMESLGQMFGFVLYASEYTGKGNGSVLSIPKVHDRAQVFISCYSDSEGEKGRPLLVGTIVRWSNNPIELPDIKCPSRTVLYILVENMGRINYGKHIFDKKGILSSVNLDGKPLYKWKMFSIPLHNLNDGQKITSTVSHSYLKFLNASSRRSLKDTLGDSEPAFYIGHFNVDTIRDTYISMSGWSKGMVFVNDFNIGRYWPSFGPQCNLYVPAPIIQDGENVVVILELEYANAELSVSSVDKPDFTCKRI